MRTTKLNKVTANINADKEIMKVINKGAYYSVESFIESAERYLKAIKERRIICSIGSVSSSGMSRTIKFLAPEFNKHSKQFQYLNFFSMFKILGFTEARSKNRYFSISGCGMDMIFHTNYTIIHKLERLGFISKKQCAELAQMTPTII